MANLCDMIERFLLDSFRDSTTISISRNGLAEHFACAPSQINYVLATRFTFDRGYVVVSRRGGGGYVEIARANEDSGEYVDRLIQEDIGEEIGMRRATGIIQKLRDDGLMTEEGARIALSAVSDKALSTPFPIRDRLRAQVLRAIVIGLATQGV